jgi:hypothetical protein
MTVLGTKVKTIFVTRTRPWDEAWDEDRNGDGDDTRPVSMFDVSTSYISMALSLDACTPQA